MRILLASLSVALTTGVTSAVAQTNGAVIHVSNTGFDSAGCGAVAQPCRSISQALALAAPGDTIQVGPGRYGDLNGNGVFGEAGEERPRSETITAPQGNPEDIDCVVCIDKAVRLVSTHGAEATSIEGVDVSNIPNARVATVQVFATGVTIGDNNAGFTISGSAAALSSIAGNLRVVDNIAVNTRTGFDLRPGGDPPTYTPYSNGFDGAVVVRRNLSISNAVGFVIQGFIDENYGRLVNNVAIGNTRLGFDLLGFAPHVMERNSAIRNQVGARGDGGPFRIEHNQLSANSETGLQFYRRSFAWSFTAQVTRNAIIGNRLVGIELSSISPGLHENNIFGNGTDGSNCGLFIWRGAHDATNNYWGAPTGPGPDPADNFGKSIEDTTPTCNGPNPDLPVQVTPYAPQPFDIR
jgi:hypothetical protein